MIRQPTFIDFRIQNSHSEWKVGTYFTNIYNIMGVLNSLRAKGGYRSAGL